MINKISFIIANFNTKKYSQWCYNSIRKNLGDIHEIVMIDDASTDGTWELLQEIKKKDSNLIIHRNKKNLGIPYSFNKMVELANNEIIFMIHSDMYVPPKFDQILLKHMKDYDFITVLRVEPDVGYPPSKDKLIIDFGKKSESFKEKEFLNWSEKNSIENKGRIEQRMFFPWMIKKSLYNKIGGNDLLFSKYMVDDDDFYLRIKMSGAKYGQLFETAVYHMPSKSVRMRENNKINFDSQYHKSIRNFIRKWGVLPSDIWSRVSGDIIIPNKYDVGFVVNNCNYKILHLLEPWCSDIYIEDSSIISKYCELEQKNTLYSLTNKVHLNQEAFKNKIVISFDSNSINNERRVVFLQSLTRYLSKNKEIGKIINDIFTIEIKSLERIENINLLPIHTRSKIKYD